MKAMLKLALVGAFILLFFKSEWQGSVTGNISGIQQNDFEDIYRFLAEEADECRRNIELGKLGSERSNKKAIREFGLLMVNDYSALLKQIEMMAMKREMKLPNMISYNKFKTLYKLRKRHGNGFDRIFLKTVHKNLKKDIIALKCVYPFEDEELQALIGKNMEMNQAHLDMLKKVKKRN